MDILKEIIKIIQEETGQDMTKANFKDPLRIPKESLNSEKKENLSLRLNKLFISSRSEMRESGDDPEMKAMAREGEIGQRPSQVSSEQGYLFR